MRKPTAVKCHGFTLVEILAVVVIIGIAGAIIIPEMSTRDDLKAAAAARLVMADLIYAQNLAITLQQNRFVDFSITNRRYSVTDAAMAAVQHPVNHTTYTVKFGAGGSYGLTGDSLVSADFKGTTNSTLYPTLGFDELGTPLIRTGAGVVETLTTGAIVVQSGVQKLEIDIEPYTGQISVKSIN